MIIWLFHLNKTKGKPIDKQRYIGTEFVLPILTSKFCRKMEGVVAGMIKIYQLNRRYCFKALIKSSPQIIIIEFFANILQYLLTFAYVFRIEFFELTSKNT